MRKNSFLGSLLTLVGVLALGGLAPVFAAIPKEIQSSSRGERLPDEPLLREFTLLSQKRDALFTSQGNHGARISSLRERTLGIQRQWLERFLRGEGPAPNGEVFSSKKRSRGGSRSFAVSTQSGELYWVRPQRISKKGSKAARSWVFLSDDSCVRTPATQACAALETLRTSPQKKLVCGNSESSVKGSAFRELWAGTAMPGFRVCQYSDRSLLIARAPLWMDLLTPSEK